MSRGRPGVSFIGRRVRWHDVKPNHDKTVLMPTQGIGYIIEIHWEGTTCYAIVSSIKGELTQHEITDLILEKPPTTETKVIE